MERNGPVSYTHLADEGVVIAYGSMYGNTEQMAEAIAAELSAQGIKNIVMHLSLIHICLATLGETCQRTEAEEKCDTYLFHIDLLCLSVSLLFLGNKYTTKGRFIEAGGRFYSF